MADRGRVKHTHTSCLHCAGHDHNSIIENTGNRRSGKCRRPTDSHRHTFFPALGKQLPSAFSVTKVANRVLFECSVCTQCIPECRAQLDHHNRSTRECYVAVIYWKPVKALCGMEYNPFPPQQPTRWTDAYLLGKREL